MPNIIDRARRMLLSPQIREIERLTGDLVQIMESRPTPMSPESFLAKLGEMDPMYLDFLMRQMRDGGYAAEPGESMRLQSVQESRNLYLWDVVTQTIIGLWTDYGFGVHVNIVPRDTDADKTWTAFWAADVNQAVINDRDLFGLSDTLLTDGEFYFVFFISRLDGACTIRTVPTDQIKEIVADPDDANVPLFYRREYAGAGTDSYAKSAYYPDWRATDAQLAEAKLPAGAVRADQQNPDLHTGTDVVMMQVAHRKRNLRGWPLMTAGAAWSRAYKNFLQDRAAVSKAVAAYVDKIIAKTGSRGIADLKAKLQSSLNLSTGGIETNPAPAAGSLWLENEAATRERMPLTTGAGDAEKDGAPLLAQAGLAGRIYPHYLGRGEAFRLATTTSMEGPTLRAFNRYQLFWSSVWSDVVRLVLKAAEEYGQKKFANYTADINTDSILQMDLNTIAPATKQLIDLQGIGAISNPVVVNVAEHLVKAALTTMGIKDADALFEAPKGEEEQYKAPLLKKSAPPANPPNPATNPPGTTPPGGGTDTLPSLQPNDSLADPLHSEDAGPMTIFPDGSVSFWEFALSEEAKKLGLKLTGGNNGHGAG